MHRLLLFCLVLCGCSCRNKIIIPDKTSFAIVNMNHDFSIVDLKAYSLDELGLTCNKCFYEGEKVFLVSAVIDSSKGNYSYKTVGWSASYYCHYDTIGRLKSQTVSSCYNWNISYRYLDSLNSIYQFSKIDHETGIDTTIYELDLNGRVIEIKGVEYGDLYKRHFSKKAYYSKNNSVPDSIFSIYSRGGIDEMRKEVFYHRNKVIDSAKIDVVNYEIWGKPHHEYVNYFDQRGCFRAKRIINSNFKTDKFYVEKLSLTN